MIIVLGSVVILPGHEDKALALSQTHVLRSRSEPGCIAHAVHWDTENPQRLVFVERWEDQAALQAHFKVPESGQFVQALSQLASEPAEIAMYESVQIQMGG